MPKDEVIFFKRPPLGARLMAFDLAAGAPIAPDLRRIFATFGPLQSLDVVGDLAFVNFYSGAAADGAMAELGSQAGERANDAAPSVFGRKLKVRRRTRAAESGRMDWLLPDEAIAMANEFFGFSGWYMGEEAWGWGLCADLWRCGRV